MNELMTRIQTLNYFKQFIEFAIAKMCVIHNGLA